MHIVPEEGRDHLAPELQMVVRHYVDAGPFRRVVSTLNHGTIPSVQSSVVQRCFILHHMI